ncbi:MAG: glycoside hydrolase family 15 protein [Pseudonocardiales bacterium]|nr:glycoside hydrolase family 15 protein [Pseudonocardiales bacterium]
MVLETTYIIRSGWLTVTDALLVAPWDDATAGELPPYRRVPRDRRAAHVLLRTARCSHGSVELAFECDPVFDYGARRGTWSRDGDRTARVRHPDGGVELSLTGDLRLGIDGDRVRARTVLREGDEVFVALSWSGSRPPTDLAEAREGMATTATFWRDWLARGCFPDHPWRAHLQRSALVLKGLIYAPTGAMVAAATSSLPETLGGERNWDYRYTWIRDAAFTLWGLYTLGFDAEADDFLRFVAEVSGGEADRLHIMYGIDGERELPERTLDHLSGYAGSRPVRVGNGAYAQAQHDVWGILLDAIQLHTAGADHLPDWLWPIVERQVEQACTHWRDPDHGIWEVRGKPQHFTASKVLCWVAADRGARLAHTPGCRPSPATRDSRSSGPAHSPRGTQRTSPGWTWALTPARTSTRRCTSSRTPAALRRCRSMPWKGPPW